MKIVNYRAEKCKSHALEPRNYLLFTEKIRRNRLIGAPENWDGFFETVSQLKDLDGFLSASERGQLIQESEDNQ